MIIFRELEVFGFAYEYDVVANLRLILDFLSGNQAYRFYHG